MRKSIEDNKYVKVWEVSSICVTDKDADSLWKSFNVFIQ